MGGGEDCVREQRNQNYYAATVLIIIYIRRHRPQEQFVVDAGWMSQLPQHLGVQHDQLVNCAIFAEMDNCSLVTII